MTIFIFTIIIILLLITGTALSLPTIGSQSDDWQKAWAALFCSKQHRSKQALLLQTQSGFCKHKQQRRRTMIGRGGDGPTNQVVVRTRRKLRRLASTEESRSDQRAPQTQSLGEPVRSPSSSRALLNILLLPLFQDKM